MPLRNGPVPITRNMPKHSCEFCVVKAILRIPTENSLNCRGLIRVFTLLLCFVFFISNEGIARSADKIGEIHELFGFYAGSAIRFEKQFGDFVPKKVGIAEIGLLKNSHFRFAAVLPDNKTIWSRGTFESNDSDRGELLEFNCEDISGKLSGVVSSATIQMVYEPQPLKRIFFQLSKKFETGESCKGWPVEVGLSAVSSERFAGIYRGNLFLSLQNGGKSGEEIGKTFLVIEENGSLFGAVLAQFESSENIRVLSPFRGYWNEVAGEFSAQIVWGSPKPALNRGGIFLRGCSSDGFKVFRGQVSANGVPCDTFSFDKIGENVDAEAGSDNSSADAQAVEKIYSLAAFLIQSPSAGDDGLKSLFPIRVSSSEKCLFVKAPDDPETWLPFPLKIDDNRRLNINVDGKSGYLVRCADNALRAFSIYSPRVLTSETPFPSAILNHKMSIITLDCIMQPIIPNDSAHVEQNRYCFLAGLSE